MRSGQSIVAAAATVSFAAVAALLGAGVAYAEPGEPDLCLATTSGTLTTTGTTFGSTPNVSWSVTKGCATVKILLAGNEVADSGSARITPAVTTTIQLRAKYGPAAKILASKTVITTNVIGYCSTLGPDGLSACTRSTNFRGAGPVSSQGSAMLATLNESDRARMVGRIIEVHVVPPELSVTQIPTYKSLAGPKDCGGYMVVGTTCDGRPYSKIRGGGGVLIGNRVAMFVGAEEMQNIVSPTPEVNPANFSLGYVFAHELGHTVLDFMMNRTLGQQAYDYRMAIGGPWVGYLDSYSRSDIGEYWAEGTAAWFGYRVSSQFAADYTKTWLQANDSNLYVRLASVYADLT
jgi:hypothetical protein